MLHGNKEGTANDNKPWQVCIEACNLIIYTDIDKLETYYDSSLWLSIPVHLRFCICCRILKHPEYADCYSYPLRKDRISRWRCRRRVGVGGNVVEATSIGGTENGRWNQQCKSRSYGLQVKYILAIVSVVKEWSLYWVYYRCWIALAS